MWNYTINFEIRTKYCIQLPDKVKRGSILIILKYEQKQYCVQLPYKGKWRISLCGLPNTQKPYTNGNSLFNKFLWQSHNPSVFERDFERYTKHMNTLDRRVWIPPALVKWVYCFLPHLVRTIIFHICFIISMYIQNVDLFVKSPSRHWLYVLFKYCCMFLYETKNWC